jgi:uncharacterized membrane protein YgdD (TMEM256/DUF423 family)
MNRSFLIIGAITGALSVMLGAFGAHGLKQHVTADTLEVYETAVRYQFYHTFALLVVGILLLSFPGNWLTWAGRFFVTGIILFCGSLYVITLLQMNGKTVPMLVGILTPLGGLFFILGWISLLAGIIEAKG